MDATEIRIQTDLVQRKLIVVHVMPMTQAKLEAEAHRRKDVITLDDGSILQVLLIQINATRTEVEEAFAENKGKFPESDGLEPPTLIDAPEAVAAIRLAVHKRNLELSSPSAGQDASGWKDELAPKTLRPKRRGRARGPAIADSVVA